MLKSSWAAEAASPSCERRAGSPLLGRREYVRRLDRDEGCHNRDNNGNKNKSGDDVGILIRRCRNLRLRDSNHIQCLMKNADDDSK